MSYRGRPSKGCEQCRARKVKCDEKKPVCGRCSKANNECTYRDQDELLFRNQSAIAAQRAEHSWRKRSRAPREGSSRTQADLDDQQDAIFAPGSDWAMRMAIPPGIKPDPRALAYHRFQYDFLMPGNRDASDTGLAQSVDDLFTFIPTLYQSAGENSAMVNIVNAIAYINFAHRYHVSDAETMAEQNFWKAIKALSRVVTNNKEAATNEALFAVYLMSVYEMFSIQQRKGSAVAHQTGANALLHLRTVEQYCSDSVSASVFESVFWQQLVGCLHAARHPTVSMQDIDTVKTSFISLESRLLMRLVWREIDLRAQWHETKRSEDMPTTRAQLHEFLRAALELDADFEAWETTAPPDWQYQTELNTPEARSKYTPIVQKLILGIKGAPGEIHSFASMKKCWIWGFGRFARIFLLRDLLEMVNWMLRLPEQTLSKASMSDAQASLHDALPEMVSSSDNLDNDSLLAHLTFANTQMITVIENFCAGMVYNFTASIDTKSPQDVVSMTGFTCVFSFGAIDAALASGLVPDSHVSDTPSSSSQSSASPVPSPPSAILEDINPHPIQLQLAHRPATSSHWSNHVATTSSSNSSISPPPMPDIEEKIGHILDFTPPHEFDSRPWDLPGLDFSGVEPKEMDVAARREWLQCVLYYIGTELGINKALYVPFTEGYMRTVKPIVESIVRG